MEYAQYRIESNQPLMSRLSPRGNFPELYQDRALAVAIAAKIVTRLAGQEVRVVHVSSGEIVFRTPVVEAPLDPGRWSDFDA